MSCVAVTYTRQLGEDIAGIRYIDDTASAGNVANITARMALLAPGSLTLAASATPVAATFAVTFRAAAGAPGDADYIAAGYDFALAAGDQPAGLAPGRYLFDYTDTTGGAKRTSAPAYIVLRKAASA